MQCSKCGVQLPDAARFCDQCGQVMGPPVPKPMQRPPVEAPPRPAAPAPPPPAPPIRPQAPVSPAPGLNQPPPLRPQQPSPAPPGVNQAPPGWSPPPARPPAAAPGGRPAMPRPPQPPTTSPSAPERSLAGGTAPVSPPLPASLRPDQPFNTAPQDPGSWFAPQRPSTAAAPEVNVVGEVTLVLVESNAPFVLAGREQYLIGREDPDEGIYPDLDLTLSGGEDAGVSRRHALLSYRNGAYWLEDLDSYNYTFVNGLRIDPRRPQVLRDGDEISLAKLRMRFQQGRSAFDWR